MKFKQIGYLIALSISFFLMTGCSDDPEPIQENEEEVVISEDPFLNFSVEGITQNTKNESIILGVQNMVNTYKDKVINIRIDAEEKRNTVIEEAAQNLKETQIEFNNKQELYSQDCIDIKNETQAETCKNIDGNIDAAAEKIQNIESNEKTQIDNINIEEIKRLSEIKKGFIEKFETFEKENKIDLKDPF